MAGGTGGWPLWLGRTGNATDRYGPISDVLDESLGAPKPISVLRRDLHRICTAHELSHRNRLFLNALFRCPEIIHKNWRLSPTSIGDQMRGGNGAFASRRATIHNVPDGSGTHAIRYPHSPLSPPSPDAANRDGESAGVDAVSRITKDYCGLHASGNGP